MTNIPVGGFNKGEEALITWGTLTCVPAGRVAWDEKPSSVKGCCPGFRV